MAVFNVDERKNIMDYITTITERNEHIISLITVGSGSYGYNDELSDLDMVIALDSDDNMGLVMDYMATELNKRLEFICFKQVLPRRLQLYISNTYLEIDIGYGYYAHAAAIQKHWRVIFDKSGTVDAAMRSSWERQENTSKSETLNKKAFECADSVWHYLMHAAVAIKRVHYWRANAELELARNLYLSLLGCRYSLDLYRGKELDMLPESELDILKKTLVTELERDALIKSLRALTDAVYTELERYDEGIIRINRGHVNEYIDFCLNN